MDPRLEHELLVTRRHFFGALRAGLGTIALASLCDRELRAADGNAGRCKPERGSTAFRTSGRAPGA